MRSIENRKLLLTKDNFEETNLFLTSTYEEIRNDSCTPREFKSIMRDIATKSHEVYNHLNQNKNRNQIKKKIKQLVKSSKYAVHEIQNINYIRRIFSFKLEIAHKKILQYNYE